MSEENVEIVREAHALYQACSAHRISLWKEADKEPSYAKTYSVVEAM